MADESGALNAAHREYYGSLGSGGFLVLYCLVAFLMSESTLKNAFVAELYYGTNCSAWPKSNGDDCMVHHIGGNKQCKP